MNTKSELTIDTVMDSDTCGVTKTIKVIGAKWTTLILRDLFEGTKRFGELQRSLQGISSKTLAVRLQELEADGIIRRQVFAEVPLRVEYSLTDKGLSLRQIIDDMRAWGNQTA
jgi:DNA-binding HxlR family transcriptional regulator